MVLKMVGATMGYLKFLDQLSQETVRLLQKLDRNIQRKLIPKLIDRAFRIGVEAPSKQLQKMVTWFLK